MYCSLIFYNNFSHLQKVVIYQCPSLIINLVLVGLLQLVKVVEGKYKKQHNVRTYYLTLLLFRDTRSKIPLKSDGT